MQAFTDFDSSVQSADSSTSHSISSTYSDDILTPTHGPTSPSSRSDILPHASGSHIHSWISLGPEPCIQVSHLGNPQMAIDHRPIHTGESPLQLHDIISPKSMIPKWYRTTSTPPHPAESLGRNRSLALQRDPSRLSPLTRTSSASSVSECSKLTTVVKPNALDDVWSADAISQLPKKNVEDELESLTSSFVNSAKLKETDLTPIQSFKKFRPLPLSRLSVGLKNTTAGTAQREDDREECPVPLKKAGSRLTDAEILADFRAPSYSLEEETRKVQLLRVKEAQMASNRTPIVPLLTIEGLPFSNYSKVVESSSTVAMVSRKRKVSDEVEEEAYVSARIKIAHRSPRDYAESHLRSTTPMPAPDLAELRATMPASSRRIRSVARYPTDQLKQALGTGSCAFQIASCSEPTTKDPSRYLA